MPVVTPKKSKKSVIQKKKIANAEAKDYSNDPFFVKKAKTAETFLKKNGLPPIELNR